MCEANVYLDKEGNEELFLEAVDVIKPEGDGLYLRNILGEQKTINAGIKEISLVNHRIVLQKN